MRTRILVPAAFLGVTVALGGCGWLTKPMGLGSNAQTLEFTAQPTASEAAAAQFIVAHPPTITGGPTSSDGWERGIIMRVTLPNPDWHWFAWIWETGQPNRVINAPSDDALVEQLRPGDYVAFKKKVLGRLTAGYDLQLLRSQVTTIKGASATTEGMLLQVQIDQAKAFFAHQPQSPNSRSGGQTSKWLRGVILSQAPGRNWTTQVLLADGRTLKTIFFIDIPELGILTAPGDFIEYYGPSATPVGLRVRDVHILQLQVVRYH